MLKMRVLPIADTKTQVLLMLQVTRAEPRRCVNAEAGGYLAGASSLRR